MGAACSICLNVMQNSAERQLFVLECGHSFHGDCVSVWLRWAKLFFRCVTCEIQIITSFTAPIEIAHCVAPNATRQSYWLSTTSGMESIAHRAWQIFLDEMKTCMRWIAATSSIQNVYLWNTMDHVLNFSDSKCAWNVASILCDWFDCMKHKMHRNVIWNK